MSHNKEYSSILSINILLFLGRQPLSHPPSDVLFQSYSLPALEGKSSKPWIYLDYLTQKNTEKQASQEVVLLFFFSSFFLNSSHLREELVIPTVRVENRLFIWDVMFIKINQVRAFQHYALCLSVTLKSMWLCS